MASAKALKALAREGYVIQAIESLISPSYLNAPTWQQKKPITAERFVLLFVRQ